MNNDVKKQIFPKGGSMSPLISGGKDEVILRLTNERPKVGDIILFKDQNGKNVLHRVIKISQGGEYLQTMGDSCISADAPIRAEDVLGIAEEIKKKRITIKTNHIAGALYGTLIRLAKRIFRKNSFTVKMADVPFEIKTKLPQIRNFFADYLTDDKALFTLKTDPQNLAKAEASLHKADENEGREYRKYSEFELERTALHELVAEALPKYGAFLFHASAIEYEKEAVLFTAVSGIGKSTHARYWINENAGTAYINDDKPFLAVRENKAFVYGSPWMGKHGEGRNCKVPVRAICLLSRAEKTSIEEIDSSEYYPLILQQVYRAQDKESLAKTLKLAEEIIAKTKCYSLKCANNPEAAVIARQKIF